MELAEMVKRLPKLDWSQRESVRAASAAAVGAVWLSALSLRGCDPACAQQVELSTANGEQ